MERLTVELIVVFVIGNAIGNIIGSFLFIKLDRHIMYLKGRFDERNKVALDATVVNVKTGHIGTVINIRGKQARVMYKGMIYPQADDLKHLRKYVENEEH